MSSDLQTATPVLRGEPRREPSRARSVRDRLSAPKRAAVYSLLIFVVFLVLWQAIVRVFDISPYILPTPTALAGRLVHEFEPGPASMYGDIWTTFREMIIGYVIAAVLGLFIGLGMARVPGLERIAYPYVFALQAIPMVALAPLLIIWFGFGLTSKVLIVALCAFFPMMVSSLAAFKSVDAGQEQLFQALCASRTRTFLKLRVPSALPFLLAGLDLSLVHSLVGAIVAEFVSGQSGLGVRLLTYNSQVDVTGSFAVILVLCALGVVMHTALVIIRNRSLSWMPKKPGRIDQLPGAVAKGA
jgi:NitT/TauT family transport system permease protein